MPRPYTQLLPLWYYQERLRLSDRYPSGLEWAVTSARHKEGEMAGRWTGRYYVLRIAGDTLHAHRVVYYMRTGTNPENFDVVHDANNTEKDNRKELKLFLRNQNLKSKPQVWRCDWRPTPSLTTSNTNGEPQLKTN